MYRSLGSLFFGGPRDAGRLSSRWAEARARRGPVAFWSVSPDRLTVAVLGPTGDEPLLVACTSAVTSADPPARTLAPGLQEAASAVSAVRMPHVVALGASVVEWLESLDEGTTGTASALAAPVGEAVLVAPVVGAEDVSVRVARTAVADVRLAFALARLRLLAVDCEQCALANLATALGHGTGAAPAATERLEADASLQPLAAVSVATEAEETALALGDRLAVPVGLALGLFGVGRSPDTEFD